ncbi:MAG: hypothetical protein WDM77_06545 [Steroidobacteraceae bacterium]
MAGSPARPPPLASARDLLRRLDALDEQGRVTAHGREMARLPLHPRLAHMMVAARQFRCVPLAADLAALLSERDLLRAGGGFGDADIRSRLSLLHGESEPAGLDRGALQRARRLGQGPLASVTCCDRRIPIPAWKACCWPAPILIASRASVPAVTTGICWPTGRGAQFAQPQTLAQREFIVAIDADDRDRDARITLAAPLSRADLEEYFRLTLRVTDEVLWDDREQAVLARRVHDCSSLRSRSARCGRCRPRRPGRRSCKALRNWVSRRCPGIRIAAICRPGWSSCAPMRRLR